ncbi:conjugal transfer protein TraI [Dyadobacter sp. 3J3]|uniref:conjugal transfer protein TraI n=1 Tax=Dyadobacter sp. 3J3 TaxID=2606600 RepID=UPI001E46DCC9|nr:conjugal transfer protein TraI [Dyadobacter sp. 3J3]
MRPGLAALKKGSQHFSLKKINQPVTMNLTLRRFTMILIFCAAMLAPVPETQAAIPWAQIIKEAIKKVVKAVDLLIQRRQNKVIKLQNAQKALENVMSKLKLEQIADWVKKQRDLYKEYYDELKKVKAVISYYFKIKQLAEKNLQVVQAYQRMWALLQKDPNFKADERAYMKKVYESILDETAKNVELLSSVVKAFTLQMTDAQRLALIDQAAARVDSNYSELLSFNRENKMLSLSRAKTQQDIDAVKSLYGLP